MAVLELGKSTPANPFQQARGEFLYGKGLLKHDHLTDDEVAAIVSEPDRMIPGLILLDIARGVHKTAKTAVTRMTLVTSALTK